MEQGYFPPHVLDVDPHTDEFKRSWYTRFLEAMNEPPLAQLGVGSGETYRFLWLRTFHRPITVHIERHGDDGMLVAKELDGRGGYEPGMVSREVSTLATAAEWDRLIALLEGARYWEMPRDMMGPVIDGALWLLEGYREGEYQVVNRHCPRAKGPDGGFREACLYLLALSGIETNLAEVY